MFDRRNDCSLMALEEHCCLLIVTLALVGGGGACRRCISVRSRQYDVIRHSLLHRKQISLETINRHLSRIQFRDFGNLLCKKL